IEPTIHADIATGIGVFGGLRCSFLLNGTLEQYEELVAPATGTFENDASIRNRLSGVIFALQPLMASVVAGIRTYLPLNTSRSTILVPEISASAGLTSVTGNEEWRVHSIRAGVSLMHEWRSAPEPAADSATLEVRCDLGVSDGQREASQGYLGLRVRERTDVVMPLPGIFFDDDDSQLPGRWQYGAKDSVGWIDDAPSPAMAALTASHAILDIIGRRLRMHAEETVDIVGVTETTSQSPDLLAQRRCESVARILEQSHDVARSRMRLRLTTAQDAVRSDTSGLSQEAMGTLASLMRNSVIVSGSPRVTGPVVGRASERTWTPALLRIRPQVRGTDDVRDWEVRVEWRDRTLRVFRGTLSLPVSITVDMREVDAAVVDDDSLVVVVSATGRRNTMAATREIMPVRRQRDLTDSSLTVLQTVPLAVGSGRTGTDAAGAWTSLVSAIPGGLPLPCDLSVTAYASDRASRRFLERVRKVSPCMFTERAPSPGPFLATPSPETRLLSTSILIRHLRAR
ncbi:MAG: hypothetical protein ACKOB6_09705, partial [Candidatus Kapaibacterium sp.]